MTHKIRKLAAKHAWQNLADRKINFVAFELQVML
jgi:hypothetical protein